VSSARRTEGIQLVLAVAVALSGCGGGGNAGPDAGKRRDAGASNGSVAGVCGEKRCAADETLIPNVKGCRCTRDGVRMRLGAPTDLPRDFYAQPWPLATRLRKDGSLDLDGFPTPAGASFVRNNLQLLATSTRGFGTNGALFASFDGALDAGSLPASPADSLAQESAVFLLDIDPHSPDRATRTPILCAVKEASSEYHPAHFLACRPVPGFPLRPDTLYGLYFTDGLHAANGTKLVASQRWQDVLDGRDDEPARPSSIKLSTTESTART
jgi:hypothetical protein